MGYVCLSQAQFPHEVRILGNCREHSYGAPKGTCRRP